MIIEHTAFNVPDPVGMAAWYVKHLGMRIVRKLDQAPFTHFIADEAGKGVMELYAHSKAPIPEYRSMDPLMLHTAFVSTDVKADRQRLLAAGATSAGEVNITASGDEMCFLHDPWGVAVQLVRRAKPLL